MLSSRLKQPFMLLVTLALLLLTRTTHGVALDPTAADASHRDLTSADVAQIVTAAVEMAISPSSYEKPPTPRRPLFMDVAGSNATFEEFVGRALPVDAAQWLPETPYSVMHTSQVLSCSGFQTTYSRCRLQLAGQLARIHLVRVDSATKNLVVYVHVIFNSPGLSPEILTFTALVHVYSRRGRWIADQAKSAWAVA